MDNCEGRQGSWGGCCKDPASLVLSPSRPPYGHSLHFPQVCDPSAREGGSAGQASVWAAPSPRSCSLGISAASPATPRPCRPAETALPSHSAPHKTNTAISREPQGLAMKNRCLPETCQPRLCVSPGSPPPGQGRGLAAGSPECSAPRALHGAQQPQETVTSRTACSQASGARELWSQPGSSGPGQGRQPGVDEGLAFVPSSLSQLYFAVGSGRGGCPNHLGLIPT